MVTVWNKVFYRGYVRIKTVKIQIYVTGISRQYNRHTKIGGKEESGWSKLTLRIKNNGKNKSFYLVMTTRTRFFYPNPYMIYPIVL